MRKYFLLMILFTQLIVINNIYADQIVGFYIYDSLLPSTTTHYFSVVNLTQNNIDSINEGKKLYCLHNRLDSFYKDEPVIMSYEWILKISARSKDLHHLVFTERMTERYSPFKLKEERSKVLHPIFLDDFYMGGYRYRGCSNEWFLAFKSFSQDELDQFNNKDPLSIPAEFRFDRSDIDDFGHVSNTNLVTKKKYMKYKKEKTIRYDGIPMTCSIF